MNIDDLLNKYFEGETSFEEEQRIRAYFASDKIPPRLAVYKPMFAYFDEEIQKRQEKKRNVFLEKRRLIYYISGVAAGVLLFLGISYFMHTEDPCSCSGNYVVVNGRCYTDMDKVREFAFDALREVATPVNEYFPEQDMETTERELIENQLKELSHIFSDDE